MASSAVNLSAQTRSSSFPQPPSQTTINPLNRNLILLRFQFHRTPFPLQASRRIPNLPQEGNNLVNDHRNRSRNQRIVVEGFDYEGENEDDDDDDGEEEDRSLDLLVRFVQNVFKKVSRKARKAVRSVLPPSISSKLVGFSVNGVIMLAFLWILKAFLEVICTLGTVVFISILLIQGIWAGVSYLQESRKITMNGFDDDQHTWSDAQPVT